MSTSSGELPQASPVDALRGAVETRQQELTHLLGHFQLGMELVADHDRLNSIITASSRPDLVLTNPAEQKQISYPYAPRQINNFTPNMQSFGPVVYGEEENWMTRKLETVPTGRRSPTPEELELYFFMGARGTYEEHHAFAEAHGVDRATASDMYMQTHVSKGAFMRMWIALPELTATIMDHCLDDRSRASRAMNEEIYVAYTVMSQLVDTSDSYVMESDGTINSGSLCT